MTSGIDVNCDPATEILFTGDFSRSCLQTLTIKNPSKAAILFKVLLDKSINMSNVNSNVTIGGLTLILFPKVKTTSPHRYVVKPHKGQIQGNGAVQVVITLLPFHFKADLHYRNKFLVQVRLTFLYFKKIRQTVKDFSFSFSKSCSGSVF
jgi:hypothetical protein